MELKPIVYDFPGEFHKPNIKAFMEAFDAEISELVQAFEDLIDTKAIDEAEGENLDRIGITVGLSRAEAESVAGDLIEEIPISDEVYRKLIKMRARQLSSKGTISDIVGMLKEWNENSDVISYDESTVTATSDATRAMLSIAGGVNYQGMVLSAPVISIDEDILTIIDTSGHAESYEIYVDGELEEETSSTTFDMSVWTLAEGSYIITVKSVAEDWTTSGDSNAEIYHLATRLSSPVITLQGTTLSWSAITNALGYRVVALGIGIIQTTTITNTSINVYDWLSQHVAEFSVVTITVVALGDGTNYEDSLASNAVSYTVTNNVPAPVLGINGAGVIITDTFADVEEYDIYLDGDLVDTINA